MDIKKIIKLDCNRYLGYYYLTGKKKIINIGFNKKSKKYKQKILVYINYLWRKSKEIYYIFQRMERKAVILIFLMLFLKNLVYGGLNPAAFLDLGVGARATGMGGAFTSVSDDPTATYWNPAGLGRVTSVQGSCMLDRLGSSEWPGIEDINPSFQFVNIIIPLNKIKVFNKGAVGISYESIRISDISKTYEDESGVVHDGTFNDIEKAYFLSAGFPLLSEDVMLGGSFKYLTQEYTDIKDAKAWGWDVDGGLLISLNKRFDVGVFARKGAELIWDNEHVDKGFPGTRIGLSYKRNIVENISVLGAGDLIQNKDMPLKGCFGFEMSYCPDDFSHNNGIQSTSIRTGINSIALENRHNVMNIINQSLNWSLGGGIKFSFLNLNLQVDYAFDSHQLGAKHKISIIMEQ
ncbi:MAG: hypothetical protein ACOC5R_04930 [Elusimicrobiota bacterium]